MQKRTSSVSGKSSHFVLGVIPPARACFLYREMKWSFLSMFPSCSCTDLNPNLEHRQCYLPKNIAAPPPAHIGTRPTLGPLGSTLLSTCCISRQYQRLFHPSAEATGVSVFRNLSVCKTITLRRLMCTQLCRAYRVVQGFSLEQSDESSLTVSNGLHTIWFLGLGGLSVITHTSPTGHFSRFF